MPYQRGLIRERLDPPSVSGQLEFSLEVNMVNRKLIRPSLSDLREQAANKYSSPGGQPAAQRRRVPPEQTNAEQYYYVKQMSSKTPMVIKLMDGELIRGVIEWYDRYCIKVNRETEPNLLIPKHQIKYMFKENEVKGSDENILTSAAIDEQ